MLLVTSGINYFTVAVISNLSTSSR